jgi:hypothetical protein
MSGRDERQPIDPYYLPDNRRPDIDEPMDPMIDRDDMIKADENPMMLSEYKLTQMLDSPDPQVQQKAREEFERRYPPEEE